MVEIDDVLFRKLREAGIISETAAKILTDPDVRRQYQRFIKNPGISDSFKKTALEKMTSGQPVNLKQLTAAGKVERNAFTLSRLLWNFKTINFTIGASDVHVQVDRADKNKNGVNRITIIWQPKGSDYIRIIKISTWYAMKLNKLENFTKTIIKRHKLPHIVSGKITIQAPNCTPIPLNSLRYVNTAMRKGIPLEALISLS